MKTLHLFITVLLLMVLACGDNPGSESIDVVVEDAATGETMVPAGNAQNPAPITEGEFLGADGNQIRVRIWTGVEPCDTVHRVEVTETADSVDLEILHGAIDPEAICPAIAVERIVVVTLQEPLGDRTLTLSGVELS
jgi:hypothetical protein